MIVLEITLEKAMHCHTSCTLYSTLFSARLSNGLLDALILNRKCVCILFNIQDHLLLYYKLYIEIVKTIYCEKHQLGKA